VSIVLCATESLALIINFIATHFIVMLLGRKKIQRGRPRSKSAPAVLVPAKSQKKRKQWSDESMRLAIEAVKSGSTILRAATLHGVPRQTLQDRISGRVHHGINPGPKPYLSPTEEKDLAAF